MRIQFNGDGSNRYQALGLPGGGKLVVGAILEVGTVPPWMVGMKKKHLVRYTIDGVRADGWLAKNKPAPKPKPKAEAK